MKLILFTITFVHILYIIWGYITECVLLGKSVVLLHCKLSYWISSGGGQYINYQPFTTSYDTLLP